MARDPRSRHELQRRLEELLGEEGAHTLMEALPPHSWDELATKTDVLAVKADVEGVRADVEGVRADVEAVKADVALLRLGFDHLDAKIDRLDERWGDRLDSSEHRLMAAFRGELNSAITAQTRTIVFSLLGSLVATGSLAIAASHFA
jgi:hypothetical protein